MNRIHKKTTALAAGLLASFGMLSSGCGQTSNIGDVKLPASMLSKSTEQGMEADSVKVARVKSVTDGEILKLPISLEGFERTMLSPRVEGYVKKVHVDIGDEVQVGTLLVELDVPELKAEFNRREMMLKQAVQSVESAKAKLEQTKSRRSEMQAMINLRQSELKRTEKLASKGSLSAEKLDEARFGVASAEASLQSVEADVNAAEADVENARAAIGVAKAEQAKARAMWDFREILSPIEGVITMRNVDPGTYVVPSAGSENALVKIERVSKLRGIMHAGNSDIKVGTVVVLMNIASEPGLEVARDAKDNPLKVTRTANVFDPRTRLMRVEVDVLPPIDPKSKQRLLKPGDYATAGIVMGEHTVQSAVPAAAIGKDAEGTFVMAVTSTRICLRVPVDVVEGAVDSAGAQRMIEAANGISLSGMMVLVESLEKYEDGQQLDESLKIVEQ